MKYKFIVKQLKIFDYKGKSNKEVYETFICTINEQGLVLPHPITNFIKINFSTHALNTQKRYAEEIKKFLNYIIENININNSIFIELYSFGTSKLSLRHGADYLDFLSNKVTSGILRSNNFYFAERVLIQFYYWLSNQNLLEENIIFKEKEVIHNEIKKITMESPFKRLDFGVPYPKKISDTTARKRRLHDFGSGRIDLVNLFISVAELEEPDIAFGIALQFYGGLRRGEVINLKVKSIWEEKAATYSPLLVKVQDNWEEIFKGKAVNYAEQVKNEREQIIFKVRIITRLYKKHMKYIDNAKIAKDAALFTSSKTGKPICGQSYYRKFNNVKRKFLEVVLLNDKIDYHRLISKPWSTHIGRGIYTNLLVFDLGWSASEVALARGDRNIESALSYIEVNNVIKLTEQAIDELDQLARARGNKFD